MKMRTEHVVCLLGLSVGIGVGTGCWGIDGSHCGNLNGDYTCADREAGEFCDMCRAEADGCTDERPMETCHFGGFGGELETGGAGGSTSGDNPAGVTGDSTGNGGTLAVDGSTSHGDTSGATTWSIEEGTTLDPSTGMGATTGPTSECADECAAQGLFCVNGECMDCDATAEPHISCWGRNQALPVCVSGTCVACSSDEPGACNGVTPVCNGLSNTCGACTEHGQCGEAACNFYTGACLSSNAVVHVGPDQQFGNLTDAANSFVGAGAEGTIIVHQHHYTDEIVVDNGRALAFLANEGDIPIWDNISGDPDVPQLQVGDGVAIIDHFEFTGRTSGPAIVIDGVGSRTWIDHGRISNRGGGILSQDGAGLTLRNSFVGGDSTDGDNANGVNALEVVGANATVIYSTLAAGSNNATALSCTDPISVVVRNSIIVARGNPESGGLGNAVDIDCDEAIITYSAAESTIPGEGNADIPQMGAPETWFADYAHGVFHLHGAGAALFAGVAQWQAGDPLTDIDGDPRVAVAGSMEHVGADLP